MLKDLNVGPNMVDFGRDALRELVRTDYGPGSSFNGIDGHGPQNHHGGSHEQVTLFQTGVSGSHMNFRFFEKK